MPRKWAQSPVVLFILGLTLVLIIGLADYWAGPEVSFSLFYFAPVALMTWYGNRWLGLITALASGVTWSASDMLAGAVYTRSFVPYWNTGMRLGILIITLMLLAELQGKLLLAERMAVTDSLTSALNKRGFELVGELEVARAERTNAPLTTAYMDLDNFKLVNDEFGHSEGDKVLQRIVSVMRANLRQTDIVARLGGDEFAVLLPDTDKDTAYGVMTRLQDALLNAMTENRFPVTFSIGVITFVHPPASVEAMIQTADRLMYVVKRSGKNRMRHEVIDRNDQMKGSGAVS